MQADCPVPDDSALPWGRFGSVGASGNGSRTGGIRANLDASTETRWVSAQSALATYPF